MVREQEARVSYDLLKKYGAKWAVLAAMEVDLSSRGTSIPKDTVKGIEMSHVKISSGCFSSCQADCDLSKIEGSLVSLASQFGDEYVDQWFDLMEKAMSGRLDSEKIANIPVLKPIESKCAFLECACGN